MPPAVYPPLRLTFPDRRDWIFSGVLAHWARRAPDRPFLQSMDEAPRSYGEVNRRVNRLTHGLVRLGVARGDRVLVMLPNSLEFLLVWWAANRIGAVEVSVNNAYKGYFLEHLVNNSGGRVMVVGREFLDVVRASEARLATLETLVAVDRDAGAADPAPRFARLTTVPFAELEAGPDEPPGRELSARDLGTIAYTSGTTGPSKGVMMPNAQCHLAAESAVNLTPLTADDVYMVTTPLYFAQKRAVRIECVKPP